MRNGFKIFDTDTHVMPAAEIIERHVDPDFRPRLGELDVIFQQVVDLVRTEHAKAADTLASPGGPNGRP